MGEAIYLITGVMASGKSTVAELLASKLVKGVHLRGDVFRRMIVTGREEMSAEPSAEAVRQLYLRYRLAVNAAKTYYENGFSVVLQDNYYGAELSYMMEQLKEYPVQLVVLCPNVDAINEREQLRGKVGYTGFTVEHLYSEFIRQTPKIGFWLDSSEQSPEQSVEDILLHFGKKEED
ncbi:AAA family ATPase [Paenibacillus sp. JNUCC31]|uniref:AAA family ATPase n=1 Tax=Paenibacillus sp. JNUCC-31 TaxID=2777983 RepID=UPI00177F6B34|nr:AAA family ATPase [Paenibacillus sp. JNUCC-31]QOS79100.1 AAA family ATPase [Paenibacillus sp. JNUCC-31]